jgi:arylsulfatase A-like enzyme
MPQTRSVTSAYQWAESTTHAPAAPTAFSSLFAGEHHTEAYTPDGGLREDVVTLPEVLSRSGYETGGFVASNPNVERWTDRFDEFWNGGLTDSGGSAWDGAEPLRNAARLLTLSNVASTETVTERARSWFESADAPRFLWIHLMNLHEPYLTDFRDIVRVGPVAAYLALYRRSRHHRDVGPTTERRLRALYDACVSSLDRKLAPLLSWLPEDALVVLTGDHGEEFDHGLLAHARLYDEVVRVPIATSEPLFDTDQIRHVDVPPTIAGAVNTDIPDRWAGAVGGEQDSVAVMTNHVPGMEMTYLGARSATHKYVRTHNEATGETTEERFDLRTYPDEADPTSGAGATETIEATLNEYLAREEVDFDLLRSDLVETDVSEEVERYLEQLGYGR